MNGLTNLPRDVTNPIFLKLTNSVAALNVFQRVSRGLKTIVDDPEFLRLLLIKLKGRKFSDPVYTSAPKKYLYLDRDLTLAIGKKIKITSIVLQDLNLRVFTLRMNNANVYHYQFSEKIKDALKTVDVRDRKRWRKCIGNIADCLAKVKIIGESTIELPYLEKIKCGFDNPNKEMKKYKIKEVFYGSAVHLIVHHKSCMTEPVLLDMVNANLNEEERGVVATSQLLSHFLLQVALVPRDGRFKLVSKGMPKENVLAKLNALTREQKAAIEQTLPDDINKYLLGTFFPTIWPTNLDDLGEEKCKKAFERFLYFQFMKSIDFKPREKGGECELIFDVTMQKSILKRLKDDAFKEMVEFETEQGALDLMKKVIFCEAWGNPPFNNNQSYFWDGTRLYSGLLGGVGELSEAVGK